MKCIYIHGRHIVDLILSGEKIMETRNSATLHRFLGETVGIILTGCGRPKLVGTVKIAGCHYMESLSAFRLCEKFHRIAPGSRYDFTGFKFGYWLENPVKYERETELAPARGNRIWREV